MTYESLSDGGFATGSMLGSGGFIVYDDRACIVRNTWNFSRFYHHESCGQCTPCREGTGWLEKVLWRIENGQGREEDIELLWSIQSKIEGNTICPLGDAASWPVAAAIRHFRDEFEYHIRFPEKVKNRDHYLHKTLYLFSILHMNHLKKEVKFVGIKEDNYKYFYREIIVGRISVYHKYNQDMRANLLTKEVFVKNDEIQKISIIDYRDDIGSIIIDYPELFKLWIDGNKNYKLHQSINVIELYNEHFKNIQK
jgi:hypothetical protein